MFLAQRPDQGPGSAVAMVVEGTRPLLVEVQALVSRSYLTSPRRTTTGIDHNRACMLLAVLEKRAGLRLSDRDVFINVAGGLKVLEPALDLAVAVAVTSSFRERPVSHEVALTGEVGLAGEVRSVNQLDRRLREAHRMGFGRAIIPGPAAAGSDLVGLETVMVKDIHSAVAAALSDSAPGAAGEPSPFDAEDES